MPPTQSRILKHCDTSTSFQNDFTDNVVIIKSCKCAAFWHPNSQCGSFDFKQCLQIKWRSGKILIENQKKITLTQAS